MSYFNQIKSSPADDSGVDAFGRERVSSVVTLFDSKQLHNNQPLLWSESFNGSASSTWSDSQTTLSVDGGTDYVIRQTKQWFNYQSGKSQLILTTGILHPEANTVKRIGYYNGGITAPYDTDLDGLYFEASGGTVSVNQAKSGSITSIVQSNWNNDKFDGTGASGIVLDFSKCQIFVIDFEWLGVGRARFGFNINGTTHYAHYFNNSNSVTSPYITSPNQPVRYEIRSIGGAGSMTHICSNVNSETGVDYRGVLFNYLDSASATLPTIGATYALLAFKFIDGYQDTTIIPEVIDILATTNTNIAWYFTLNPTIAGTLTYNPIANGSALQVAVGTASNTISNLGSEVHGGFVASANRSLSINLNDAVRLGSTISGVSDILVIAIMPLQTNATVGSAFSWREL